MKYIKKSKSGGMEKKQNQAILTFSLRESYNHMPVSNPIKQISGGRYSFGYDHFQQKKTTNH